ncbi:uncharacterized protein LOC130712317 [Lotus japonicus]|uniref:uncharacterized protein LOC130712317 n=1 Tax=Lotus japonicus TaxID=34305 RepID=UPI002582DDB4|nr:uncharacterized protein LOC130712317 [Lotus japonicus]
MIELLKEFKDCFAWDYDEMPGLSRDLVELQLPIKEDRKPVKQLPRRFHPDVLAKIKEEIERLLQCKFIRAAKYVEWLANVVPVIKKNCKMRVCIDFRDLNAATPKDEYHMPIAKMMVDSAAGHEYLSLLDGYSGYNQIFIAKEDVSKTAVYIDDIVVKSPSRDEHLSHLRKSFEKMRIHGLKMNPLKCAFGVIAGDFLGFVVHKKGIEINKNKAKVILDTSPPTSKKQLQSLLGKVNFLRRFIANLSDKNKLFSSLLRLKREDIFRWEAEHQKAFDELKTYLANPPVMIPPIKGKPMRLYISATDETIGSMLAQEDEDGIERAIFYLSRVLNDAETRYTMIEKLSLTEYSLTYAPLKAIKGQAVADFLADHTLPEEIAYVGLQPWKLFFDGSSHKEGSGIGMFIVSPQGIPTKFMFRIRESCSNNEAEYEALVSGLEILLALGAKNVEVKGDSELVVKQLTKEYKCVSENLAKYYVKAMSFLANFDQAGISYIPRVSNQEANELAKIASGYMIDKLKLKELIRIKEKLSPLDLDVMAIDNLTPNDWRKPIVEYLQNPVGSTNRKVMYRALSYTIIDNELFKKNVDDTLLKCLSEDDAFIAIASNTQEAVKIVRNIQESNMCQLANPTFKPWPFRGWAIDLIGEIHPASSRQHRYIIVAIDYFTKWVEAIPLQSVTQETVIEFIQNHIVYRFGLPESLTTDQGTVFVGRKVADFAESWGIKLLTSTPYYAQEFTKGSDRNNTFSNGLWPRSRATRRNELVNLDEERILALDVLTRQKDRIAKAYNKKVRNRSFVTGDYVWKVILPMDKKDRAYGKWAPNWEGSFKVEKALSNNAYMIKELSNQRQCVMINGKYLKAYKPMLHEIKIE